MTIGFILDDTMDRPDGVQQAIVLLGKELVSRGHNVHFIATESAGKHIAPIHAMSRSIHLKFNGNSVRTPLPVTKKRIVKLFQETSFDVLHVQMPHSPFLSGRIIQAAPPSTKIFGTFHILPYGRFARIGMQLLGAVQKKQVARFDGLFAVSTPAKRFMDTVYKVNSVVLPNPVDFQLYNQGESPKNKKITLVFVGRFEERKGVTDLVNAYSKINASLRSKTRLVMCGKGPLLEKAKNLARTTGVDIEFPGFVSDTEKKDYLKSADIAVFPSSGGESFGIVLTEAMSCGNAIVLGGNNPGYRSVLERWPETLIDPKNHEKFAQVLVSFINDDKRRTRIANDQHNHAKSFDVSVVVDKLESYYSCDVTNNKG